MGNAASGAFGFVFGFIFNTYAMIMALRFVMQLFRADYYNPLAQFVVKATDPVLRPLRRFLPSVKKYDTSSFVLIFLILLLKLFVFKLLQLGSVPAVSTYVSINDFPNASAPFLALVDMVNLFFNLFIFSIIANALLSWFPNPGTDSIRSLLSSITDPILTPIRKYVPPMGGLDLSSLVSIIGLIFVQKLVIGTLISALF